MPRPDPQEPAVRAELLAVLGFLLLVTWLALRPLPLPAPAAFSLELAWGESLLTAEAARCLAG